MRFSQRIGQTPIKTILQVESIDEALKNRLWNVFVEQIEKVEYVEYALTARAVIFKQIWKEFFNYPITSINTNSWGVIDAREFMKEIRSWFYAKASWYDVYDFVEYLLSSSDSYNFSRGLVDKFNDALKREVSGYRIVNNQVVQITSEEELQAIEEAVVGSDAYKTVNAHLKAAIDLLADKTAPNYRNSIKESISSVEAMCKIIVQDDKATLGKALAILEKQHNLHTSLKEAYSKLYGFTSDAGGIRHAMLEDGVDIDFEDAKYMLVLCSSFINYVKAKLKV